MARNNQNQGQRPQQPQSLSIREVRLVQVGRVGDVVSGRIAGKAFRGNNPAEGINLSLFVGGIQTSNSPLLTNGDGECSDDFSLQVAPGVFRITVEARTGQASGKVMVDIPLTPSPSSKPKLVADKLAASASGKRGSYIISAAVSSKEGQPIDDLTVVFLVDGEIHRNKTNDGGIASQKIVFSSKTMEVIVQVGAVTPEKLRLLGPTEAFIPPASQAGITSWWDGIKKGARAGLQALDEMKRRN